MWREETVLEAKKEAMAGWKAREMETKRTTRFWKPATKGETWGGFREKTGCIVTFAV